MAYYLTLTKKGEEKPSKFPDIDNAMCAHFGVEPDEDRFHNMWYDIEGLALATGKDWAWIRETWPERVAIIDWLDANYVADAWYER
jgi:hypothetical protein